MNHTLLLLLTSTALALVCAAQATAQETTGVPALPAPRPLTANNCRRPIPSSAG